VDGRRVEWQVQTTDGETAQFWINNVDYDLGAGALFILTTRNGTTDVRQLSAWQWMRAMLTWPSGLPVYAWWTSLIRSLLLR